jgi:hypothetical protein
MRGKAEFNWRGAEMEESSWLQILGGFLLKFFGILGVVGLVIDYQVWLHAAQLDPRHLPAKYAMAGVGALMLVFIPRLRSALRR